MGVKNCDGCDGCGGCGCGCGDVRWRLALILQLSEGLISRMAQPCEKTRAFVSFILGWASKFEMDGRARSDKYLFTLTVAIARFGERECSIGMDGWIRKLGHCMVGTQDLRKPEGQTASTQQQLAVLLLIN